MNKDLNMTLSLAPALHDAVVAAQAITDLQAEEAKAALMMMDLTSLGAADTAADIFTLLHNAQTPAGHVAAVCVWPQFVPQCVAELQDKPISVATVVNFPEGDHSAMDVAEETSQVVKAQADEIDLVFPYRAFMLDDFDQVESVLMACRTACEGRVMKVILETGVFDSADKLHKACVLSAKAGVDFLKTSTGKINQGASLDAAAVLCAVAKEFNIGVKVSGGVRTAQDAAQYMALARDILGVSALDKRRFRFGASGLLSALLGVLGCTDGAAPSAENTGY
jgi:deoxyribose-phosphate aldolase